MNLRPFLTPTFALLVAAALPVLAQMPRPTTPPPPTAPTPTTPAPTAQTPPTAPTPPATQAPGPAAAPSQPLAIPPHKCVQPPYPGRLASNSAINAFNRDNKAYGDCVKKYIDDTKLWVVSIVDAGNKAIDEYNKYTEDLKKKIEEAKE
jgi:hypothetical protein